MKRILVTGGLGYIGSHTVLKLLKADYEVIVLDNLSNSSLEVNSSIKFLSNKKFDFIKDDLCYKKILNSIFSQFEIEAVIHFAGSKSSIESDRYPLEYYENNVVGCINLFKEMANYDVKKIVFSSSTTLYGESNKKICKENSKLSPISVLERQN